MDISQGMTASATSPGTIAARAQVPQEISTPCFAAKPTASGLPAMAVTNIAEVMVLTWTEVRER
ncbi:Uncharacterised protein [Mycobacteroides abscessus subsp. abscessus]|nr:Uncharacterised protein [Mycobacteroides abscessus subsp. abscessus]